MDALDRNLAAMLQPIAAKNLKMRIATKSLRVPELIDHCAMLAGDHCAGLMTYCAAETLFFRMSAGNITFSSAVNSGSK